MNPSIFITAFEPYDGWKENSSWLSLMELTRSLETTAQVTTRLYPVEFETVHQRLKDDLADDYDFALHLGQSPGSAQIQLESIGLNVGGQLNQPSHHFKQLVDGGPVAFQSGLPVADMVRGLQAEGIPAHVSYHAGTYLCNAMLYLSHFFCNQQGYKTKITFVHLPLATSQVTHSAREYASLPTETMGRAVQILLNDLVKQALSREPRLA